MYSLPTARKSWKCGVKYEYGEEVVDLKNGCGQELYQDTRRLYASGKAMVLNARDGIGGKTHDPHVCPNRVGSKFHHFEPVNMREYDYHQEHKMCSQCAETFNSYKNPLCPVCYRLQCLECDNMQQWIVLNDQQTLCFNCGGERFEVVQIFWAYDRLYGKRVW